MAFIDVPVFTVPELPNFNGAIGSPAFSPFRIDNTNDAVGFIFQCPKAGVLDYFEWRTQSVVQSPASGLRCSWQDLVPTTGLPDGSDDEWTVMAGPFSANTWQTPGAAFTTGGGGGSKRTVAAGDWIAGVIKFESFGAGDNLQIEGITQAEGSSPNQLIYIANGTSGTFSKDPTAPVFAVKYDDGSYAEFPFGFSPILTINNPSFNSGSTPDEYALRFQLPYAARLVGCVARVNPSGDMQAVLYDNANAVISTATQDKDFNSQVGGSATSRFYFSTKAELDPNTTYRLAIKPTTVTNVTLISFALNAPGLQGAIPGGVEFYESRRTDAGAWTDFTSDRPMIGLIIDGLEGSSGGGESSAVF